MLMLGLGLSPLSGALQTNGNGAKDEGPWDVITQLGGFSKRPGGSGGDLMQTTINKTMREARNCKHYPARCQEPMNCDIDPPEPYEQVLWSTAAVSTSDGHVNPRAICSMEWSNFDFPYYEYYMLCFSDKAYNETYLHAAYFYGTMHDNNKAAHKLQRYCYKEGFCDMNEELSNTFSFEESEELCNKRYGEAWKDASYASLYAETFDTRRQAMVQCGLGMMMCDAWLCRDIVCQESKFKYMRRHGYLDRPYPFDT